MISIGAKATGGQRHLRVDNLIFGDQIDPQTGFIGPTQEEFRTHRYYGSGDLGMVFNTKSLYGGAAIAHLLCSNVSLLAGSATRIPRRYVFQAGYTWKPSDASPFSLGLHLLQQFQSGFTLSTANLLVQYKWAQLGVGRAQHNESYLFKAGIATKRIRVGYSYDLWRFQDTWNQFGNTHEVALQYRFEVKKKKGGSTE